MTATIRIERREQLVRELRALGGPKLRQVARRATTTALRPVLTAARALAPVHSGRLRASLGQLATSSRRGNFVGSRIGTRRDFVYRSTAGERLVSGSGKKRDKALARGIAQDRTTAQQYARGIHFGVDHSGRVRRKSGAIPFLEHPITAQAEQIIATVASELRRHVESAR